MNVLVTGGAGFIGSHLSARLLDEGHTVTVLDNLRTGLRESVPNGVKLLELDVRKRDDVMNSMRQLRPEIVVHLAAQMNIRRSIEGPIEDADVNILGSLQVFQAAAAAGVRRIVFASSGGGVYGEYLGRPWTESDPPRPTSPYGIAKLAAEHYGRHISESAGIEFVALRLANVYGPRQNPRGEAGIVALFLDRLLCRESPVIFGDGLQTRDYVWVGDVVDAFVRALSGPPGVYNIGTGKETTVNEIFQRLQSLAGQNAVAVRSISPGGEVRRNAVSPQLALLSLRWSPQVELPDGLQATIHGWRSGGLEKSSQQTSQFVDKAGRPGLFSSRTRILPQ